MENKKPIIPPSLFMVDCGLAQFKAASGEAAFAAVKTVMERHGGKCVSHEGNYLIFNFSNAFRHRFFTALVEPSGEGLYTASFREGDGPTDLKHYGLLLITLLLMGICVWLLRSWWSLLPCVALIAGYLLLNYAPEKAAKRRIDRIREELSR